MDGAGVPKAGVSQRQGEARSQDLRASQRPHGGMSTERSLKLCIERVKLLTLACDSSRSPLDRIGGSFLGVWVT